MLLINYLRPPSGNLSPWKSSEKNHQTLPFARYSGKEQQYNKTFDSPTLLPICWEVGQSPSVAIKFPSTNPHAPPPLPSREWDTSHIVRWDTEGDQAQQMQCTHRNGWIVTHTSYLWFWPAALARFRASNLSSFAEDFLVRSLRELVAVPSTKKRRLSKRVTQSTPIQPDIPEQSSTCWPESGILCLKKLTASSQTRVLRKSERKSEVLSVSVSKTRMSRNCIASFNVRVRPACVPLEERSAL